MKLYVPVFCPDCNAEMVLVRETLGPAHYCPKAIGAAEWDGQWKRHYFPPGNPHVEVRRWAYGEGYQERRIA